MSLCVKRYSKAEREAILSEHITEGLSISELSRKHQIHPHTIYNWRRKMNTKRQDKVVDPRELFSELEQSKKENSKLKKIVAEQALDITTLKQYNEFVKKKFREEQLNLSENSSESKASKLPKNDSVSS